jgi:hypothetical protein
MTAAKLETQVLIEQKLHFAVTMRRSRSAAIRKPRTHGRLPRLPGSIVMMRW